MKPVYLGLAASQVFIALLVLAVGLEPRRALAHAFVAALSLAAFVHSLRGDR